jgi:hypothetical protein
MGGVNMAITVKFYKTSSKDKVVDKVLTNQVTMSAMQVKETLNISEPVLKVNYNAALSSYNYAYIPEYGRYYYFKSAPDVTIGHEMIISLKIDPRKTYATAIRNCTAHVIRSSSNYDTMIPDNMIINKVNNKISQRKIGNGFTRANKYYVLIGG